MQWSRNSEEHGTLKTVEPLSKNNSPPAPNLQSVRIHTTPKTRLDLIGALFPPTSHRDTQITQEMPSACYVQYQVVQARRGYKVS
jgi:hypothetical protein